MQLQSVQVFVIRDSLLERVAQRELHYASRFGFIERSLRRGEPTEVGVRATATEERIPAEAQVRNGQTIKPLRVGNVENLPTELQRMTFPRQVERLVESHVERDVAGRAQHVSIADLTRTSRSEAAIDRQRIAEHVRRAVGVILSRRRLHRTHANTVRLHVPVCRPDTAIEWRLDRQAAVPTENAGGLP